MNLHQPRTRTHLVMWAQVNLPSGPRSDPFAYLVSVYTYTPSKLVELVIQPKFGYDMSNSSRN